MSTKEEISGNWILLLPEKCVTDDGNKSGQLIPQTSLNVITLKHPCTEEPAKFLYAEPDGHLYEINSHKDKFGSWFVNKNVCQDGSLLLATNFDPLYVILPYLKNSDQSEKFVLLDQLLEDDNFPDCHKLSKCVSQEQLKNVAEVSGSGVYVGFKYSTEKTLVWLSKKVKSTVEAVTAAKMFVPLDEDDKENNDEVRLEYSFRFIASYLDEETSDLLLKHLKIRKRAEKRRSVDNENQMKAKRVKGEAGDQDKPKKQNKMSKAQRDLSKVNKKGMKNISSFFSPKSK